MILKTQVVVEDIVHPTKAKFFTDIEYGDTLLVELEVGWHYKTARLLVTNMRDGSTVNPTIEGLYQRMRSFKVHTVDPVGPAFCSVAGVDE